MTRRFFEIIQDKTGVILNDRTLRTVSYNNRMIPIAVFMGMSDAQYYDNEISTIETVSHVIVVAKGQARAFKLDESRFKGQYYSPEDEAEHALLILEAAMSELGQINYPIAKDLLSILSVVREIMTSNGLKEFAVMTENLSSMLKMAFEIGQRIYKSAGVSKN